MSYTLKFEHPHFPEGQDFGIADLGVVENGGTLELDEDQERLFIVTRGMSVEDAFRGNELVTLTGSSSISADELTSLLPEPEETDVVDTSDSGSNNTSPASGNVLDQIGEQHEGGEN